MAQQALLEAEARTAARELSRGQTPEQREKEAPGDIAAILVDAAVHAGSLIDAVCCRVGDWLIWSTGQPHPRMSAGNRGVTGGVCGGISCPILHSIACGFSVPMFQRIDWEYGRRVTWQNARGISYHSGSR